MHLTKRSLSHLPLDQFHPPDFQRLGDVSLTPVTEGNRAEGDDKWHNEKACCGRTEVIEDPRAMSKDKLLEEAMHKEVLVGDATPKFEKGIRHYAIFNGIRIIHLRPKDHYLTIQCDKCSFADREIILISRSLFTYQKIAIVKMISNQEENRTINKWLCQVFVHHKFVLELTEENSN